MNLQLKGKRAVVTGAGGAIGGEIARQLVSEGARVAIWDINQETGDKVAAELGAASARAFACDVTDAEAVRTAMRESVDFLSGIDILVNSAGGSRKSTTTSEELPFFDILPDQMRQVMDLNYLSTVFTCQEAGRIFASQGSGSIVNIASISGITPVTRGITYSNGKAAVNSFTKWLAVHMAQNYSGKIRVNAIAPGFLLTEQNRFLLLDEKSGRPTPRGETVISQVPMGRYGSPGEIAAAAVFLASEQASFVTGTIMTVDGGLSSFLGV